MGQILLKPLDPLRGNVQRRKVRPLARQHDPAKAQCGRLLKELRQLQGILPPQSGIADENSADRMARIFPKRPMVLRYALAGKIAGILRCAQNGTYLTYYCHGRGPSEIPRLESRPPWRTIAWGQHPSEVRSVNIPCQCPTCGGCFKVAAKYATLKIKCPKCSGVIDVPKEQDSDILPVAQAARGPAPQFARPATPARPPKTPLPSDVLAGRIPEPEGPIASQDEAREMDKGYETDEDCPCVRRLSRRANRFVPNAAATS